MATGDAGEYYGFITKEWTTGVGEGIGREEYLLDVRPDI